MPGMMPMTPPGAAMGSGGMGQLPPEFLAYIQQMMGGAGGAPGGMQPSGLTPQALNALIAGGAMGGAMGGGAGGYMNGAQGMDPQRIRALIEAIMSRMQGPR